MNALKRNAVQLSVFAFVLLGFFATPFGPYDQDFLDTALSSGNWPHIFGVDKLGRDGLSRVWRGAANTMTYAFAASVATIVFSSILLFLSERKWPLVPAAIRSAVALGIGFPVVLLGLLFMIFMKREPETLVWAIGVATIPLAYRQLSVLWREQSNAVYAVASRAVGGSSWHVFWFSLLPNLKPQLFELWKLVFAVAILELSALTFLGLAGDPGWAELGSILADQKKYMNLQPLLVVWPGAVLCFLLWQIRMLRWE